jgi:hypothetical protein
VSRPLATVVLAVGIGLLIASGWSFTEVMGVGLMVVSGMIRMDGAR